MSGYSQDPKDQAPPPSWLKPIGQNQQPAPPQPYMGGQPLPPQPQPYFGMPKFPPPQTINVPTNLPSQITSWGSPPQQITVTKPKESDWSYPSTPPVPLKCICDIMDLMARGCKCGQFEREQQSKK